MNKHIAIIDDDEIFRLYLKMKVEETGRTCDLFGTCEDFFSLLEENPHKYKDVIVDRWIGASDSVTENFPAACAYYKYCGNIILFSNCHLSSDYTLLEKPFDFILDKCKQIKWDEILS